MISIVLSRHWGAAAVIALSMMIRTSPAGAGEEMPIVDVASVQCGIQPDPELIKTWPAWEQALYAKLQKPVNLTVQNTPLRDVLAQLSKQLDISIVYQPARNRRGIRVSLQGQTLSGLSLLQSLRAGELGDYSLVHGAVVVGVVPMVTREFDVRRLARPVANPDEEEEEGISLDEVVRRVLAERLAGGEAEVELNDVGVLTVVGTPAFQRDVEALLDGLKDGGKKLQWQVKTPAWEVELRKKLNTPVQEDYVDADLATVARSVCKAVNVKITVHDAPWLRSILKQRYTIYARRMTAMQVLLHLQQFSLHEDGVHVPRRTQSTRHKYGGPRLVCALHDVRDLLAVRDGNDEDAEPLYMNNDIREQITRFVAADSWGEGEGITLEMFNGQLIVIQSPEVQDKIAAYLDSLRAWCRQWCAKSKTDAKAAARVDKKVAKPDAVREKAE